MVDRDGEHQRLEVDGAHLDVLADRGRAQHAEVEGAGPQTVALVGGEHVSTDLQRDTRAVRV